ncbi:MAG TPA: cupredoxin family copper-binding protein [Terriglobales bacterium]|nr:cupredoxin family copper-binding protein [Terriglobales bacterium]
MPNRPRKTTWVLIATVILSLALLATVTSKRLASSRSEVATTSVDIDNFSFAPRQLTIPAGRRVTWINKDDVPHTIISVDHRFKSKALDTDDKFSFTFQNPGVYEYFCSVHPTMTGKIIVR